MFFDYFKNIALYRISVKQRHVWSFPNHGATGHVSLRLVTGVEWGKGKKHLLQENVIKTRNVVLAWLSIDLILRYDHFNQMKLSSLVSKWFAFSIYYYHFVGYGGPFCGLKTHWDKPVKCENQTIVRCKQPIKTEKPVQCSRQFLMFTWSVKFFFPCCLNFLVFDL